MPVASIARAINPPSASISRTRWPLAVPPTAGLHGMCATVSRDSVQSPTLQPSRAAAKAASTPACPAPITITSKRMSLLAYAESLEDMLQDVVRRSRSHDLIEAGACRLQISENELFRYLALRDSLLRPCQILARLLEQRCMTRVGNCRRVSQRFTTRHLVHDGAPRIVQARSGLRGHVNRPDAVGAHVPLRGKVRLVRSHDAPAVRGIDEQLLIFWRRRFTAIERDHKQVSDIASVDRACHTFALHGVAGVSPTRCIHERDRQALEIDLLGNQVASRTGNLGDDRAIGAHQRIEDARLAHIRTTS